MRGVNHRICFSTDNLVQIFGRHISAQDDIDVGVREAVISKVMIGTVIDRDEREFVSVQKVSEQLIPLIKVSWRASSICISTDKEQGIRIFFKSFINSFLEN